MLTTILVVGLLALAWLFRRTARQARDAVQEHLRTHTALKATQEALITQGRTLQRVAAERDELLRILDADHANRVYEPGEARVRALTGACVAGWPRTWRVRMGDA